MFFPGFTLCTTTVPGGTVRYRIGGSGPALLLLHGTPQTHAMWHRVAPAMARRFTVVCPDLRGHGGSEKPPATTDHAPYAKTQAARDLAELMTQLGYASFAVAGHDRGARVAHRLALAAPERVIRLAVLDSVPSAGRVERADMASALGAYEFWFAQPHPFPEDMAGRSSENWFAAHNGGASFTPDFFHPEALADYLSALRDPAALTALQEDYRATTTVDIMDDRISRAEGRQVQCPMLALWGARAHIGGWYDPVTLWQAWCVAAVTGRAIDAGHFLAEEAPDAVIAQFDAFF